MNHFQGLQGKVVGALRIQAEQQRSDQIIEHCGILPDIIGLACEWISAMAVADHPRLLASTFA
jgi:hypothetical protein